MNTTTVAASRLDRSLASAGLWGTAVSVLAGPWFFGAWEMWWFWPLAIPILAGGLCMALRLAATGTPVFTFAHLPGPSARAARFALWAFAAFAAYASARAVAAPVAMTAERSLLLFVLPVLVVLQVLSAGAGQLRVLSALVAADLLLLGLYGLANHLITGSARVMWAEAYEQYLSHGRASGSYYCPDHFAGIMELAAAVGIGFLMNRGNAWSRKATGAALLLVSGVGVVLSKSRGGGLSLVVMAAAALVWGFSQWRAYYRWCYRLSVGALAVVFLILFVNHSSGYMDRAANYPIFSALSGKPPGEWPAIIADVLPATDRGIMIRGALRAWRANPAWGIGPGMHQVLWPRFAATADGDRELGIWPRETNEHFHSYEVHSDWVQLLEEYGLAGFALFATASVAGFAALLLLHAFIGRDARRLKNPGRAPARIPANAALAAILAATAMAFHSLGDFNLQMPATGWMLAAIVALPFAVYRRPEPR